mmetsp:Transcript_10590/g.16169  ORF Transcript_10590/g.16169 Transcript_10590/m.16169 type:complete len:309 (-) Transcript_10590:1130-2056(-)
MGWCVGGNVCWFALHVWSGARNHCGFGRGDRLVVLQKWRINAKGHGIFWSRDGINHQSRVLNVSRLIRVRIGIGRRHVVHFLGIGLGGTRTERFQGQKGVKDIVSITPIVLFFQIEFSIGLNQCNLVMASIAGPSGFVGMARGSLVGLFVHVPNTQTTAFEQSVQSHGLSVFNQKVFSFGESSIHDKGPWFYRNGRKGVSSLVLYLGGCDPSHECLCVGTQEGRIALRSILSPNMSHEFVISHRGSLASGIVEIGKSVNVTHFVHNDTNACNRTPAGAPKSRCGDIGPNGNSTGWTDPCILLVQSSLV